MRVNQDESIVNMIRQTKKNDAVVQRTGNVERSFSKIHTHLADEYAIGTRDVNKYTITEITTQWYNDYFINTYYLTRYHNRIQQATFVDQTYRWRDNYAKTVFNRHEHYSDYLMVVPPDDTEVTETLTKIYTNYTIKKIVDILLGRSFPTKTKASIVLIRTDGMLELYPDGELTRKMIAVPLSSYGIEGGFSFTFGFANNQVAGSQLALNGTKYYNTAVRYTDSQGRFTRFAFWILSDLEIAEVDMLDYPLLTDSNYLNIYNSTVQYFGCGFMNSDNGAGEPLLVNKDPLTNYVQTYELKMLSYYVGLYVFGIKFYSDNFIVDNPEFDKAPFLYLYTDGTYYDLLEDMIKIKTTYSSVIELDSSNCSFSTELLQYRFIDIDMTGVTSWAIGDEFGELYVACNEPLNGFNIVKTHIRPGVLGIGGVGYFNKIVEFNPTIQLSMDFAYETGRQLPLSLNASLSSAMSFNYYKSKDIGIDISSAISSSLNFAYELGRMLAFDFSSALSVANDFQYRKSKDLGFNLDSSLNVALQFSYAIGDNLMYEFACELGLSQDFEYYRSKDIGYDLSSVLTISQDFAYYRSRDIVFALDSSLSLGLNLVYTRQMVYYDLGSVIAISNDFQYYRDKQLAVSLSSTLSTSLSFVYEVDYNKTDSPSLSDKTVVDNKAWGNSTATYWNAQDESNRDTFLVELPAATLYPIGFAARVTNGELPVRYTYAVVISGVGQAVSWKVTNNDASSVTVYCKVGSGSYQTYGTLATGATSSTLSRTVTDGLTTVYCYVKSSLEAPSDVVSL